MPYSSKEAELAYQKSYRQKNKEKISSRGKQYYKENKETANQRDRKYYQQNKDKIATQKKEYRQENKDSISQRQRARHSSHDGKGFLPITSYKKGYSAHHLFLESNSAFCIYIPDFIHSFYKHNSKTGKGMDTINAVALSIFIDGDEQFLPGAVA